MVRTWIVAAMVCGLGIGGFPTLSMGGEKTVSVKIEQSIRKYQKLVDADKWERAAKLAERIAEKYPEHAAAQLLKQHNQLLAKAATAPQALAQPAQAGNIEEIIVAQMVVVEIPEDFFERLGLDFDFAKQTRLGIDMQLRPQPQPGEPLQFDLISSEETTATHYAVLTPLEASLLPLLFRTEHVNILTRPVIRTLPGQPSEIMIGREVAVVNGEPKTQIDVGIKFQAEIDKDHKSLSVAIDGESQGNRTQVKTTLPLGKTLLLDLGAHVVEARQERGVPILSKIPNTERLFRNVGIARETRRRVAFITPELKLEDTSVKPALAK